MANLKDLLVNGDSTFVGKIKSTGGASLSGGVELPDGLTTKTVNLPTSSGGSTYGAGSSGQVIKTNGEDVYWGDAPTKVSELENDTGFITAEALPTATSELTNDSGFITSSALPTKTSDLTNDSDFITSSYHDSTKQDTISDLSTIRSNASTGAGLASDVASNTSARHTHSNKSVLDGITSTEVSAWDGKQGATWAQSSTATGTATLSLPSTFNEIIIKLNYGNNPYSTSYGTDTLYIPYIALSSKSQYFSRGGTAQRYFCFAVSQTAVTLNAAYIDSTSKASTCLWAYYYR